MTQAGHRLALLVADITNPRVCKIGYALKLQGWRVALLHRDELVLGTTSLSFDEATRFRTPDEALQQARLIAPAVCHVFSCWNFEVARLFVTERPAPVIFDDYDVLAGMVNEHFLDANYPDQAALERYCLEHADAICCRSLELQWAKRYLGYRLSSPMIFLQDYCWDLPDPQYVPPDRNEKGIHVVYCGNLAAEKQHAGRHRRNGFFLELAVSLAQAGIHFHIYPSPISHGVFEDTFSVHLELASRTEYFHLHRSVPPDRLIVEISRYDLGLQSSWQGSWDDGVNNPAKFQLATANKLFDYFDAGLGVVVDERRFQRHLARRMQACVEASFDNMAERLISMPADFWRQLRLNALRARTAYSMRRHAPRLAALYESLAVGVRLVRGSRIAVTTQQEQQAGTMAHSIKSTHFPESAFVGPYEQNGTNLGVPEEQWLWQNRHLIKGDVLDMSTPRYWHNFIHELPTVRKVLISDFDQPQVSKHGHSSPVDVIGDFCASPPPLPPHSVDTILCLSILEHCTDPGSMVKNLAEILKPGGVVFILAPFAYIDGHLEPDYWRFGRDGLRLLAKNAELELMDEGCFGDMGKYFMEEFGVDASARDWHRGVPNATWVICRRPASAQTRPTNGDLAGAGIMRNGQIRLYAGDIPASKEYDGWIGLSLTQENDRHIRHDITQPLPFPDNSVDAFQAEDVFEHIEYGRLVPVLNEIHRVLKHGALFRLSVPDYRCDILHVRSEKDALGNIVFDPFGGGTPEKPGHVWFPRHETLKSLLEASRFGSGGAITFLHYYDHSGEGVAHPIDYSKGHIQRTPDFDPRARSPYRPMSLVVDLSKGITEAMPQNVSAKIETMPVPNTKLVKISFVMIVLNGMPFIEYALKAIYDEAHEIIIVEGAVEKCSFAANPDGSSKDGTVECIRSFSDPYRKIRLIQGRWPEKCEMQNAALGHVTGNYVWLVDSDEIYKRGDIGTIRSLLAGDPAITQVNFIPDNFWKGFDYLFVSPRFFEPANHYRRLFKFKPGSHFTTHRPPTMVWPGLDISTEQIKLLDGATTRKMGIYPYHYSYVLDSQVRQKIELYRRYGWGDGWGLDLEKWYREFFQQWTPENSRELERLYPIWTGDPHSYSVLFPGIHPEVLEELITACRGGELSSQVGSDEKNPCAPDEQHALATAGAAECNPSKKYRIAGKGVVGSDLTQIQEGSDFETSLRELVLSIKPRTIIETGTYLGTGTTRIVATALRDAGLVGTTFYSIECNPAHHRQAYLNLDQAGLLPFVKPLLGLSVPRNLLPTVENILDDTVRNVAEDGIFVDHQEQERVALYYRETDFADIPEDLIGACLEESGGRPDLVLLDSAGHMGSVEFEYVVERLQGECYLVLDDIRHVKHFRSFQLLQKDPRFTVITSSDEKFGFCIARFNPGARVEPTVGRRWILWLRPDSIGDNILAMATLPLLKARRSDAAIAVFCQEHIAELYEACPAVDRVITFNRMRALHDEAYLTAILRQLQELRADICLNSLYSRDLFADLIATQSGAQERIALMGDLSNTFAEGRESYNRFYTSILTSAGEHKTELDRHQDFLRGIGITGERLKPSLWMLPDDSAFSDRFFKERGFEPEKTIALFAGAQYGVRLYDKYGAALAAFCRENGFSVVALGSADDYGINQHNLDAIGVMTANLSGATTLRQGAAILSRCRLAVGAETGLAHMACAVGTPNIILLGGGHFGRFIPYSPLTSVVCLPLECYGCNWRCRYERVHCVRDVSPAVIAEALRHSLAGRFDHIRYFVQGDSLWKPEDGGPTRDLSTRFMLVEGEVIMVENTYGN